MTNPARKKRTALLGDDLRPTIVRFREIAASSGDALFIASDEPPHPDRELLDLCGDVLYWAKRSDELWEEWRNRPSRYDNRGRHLVERDDAKAADAKLTQLLRRAKKLPATTPAGIYAKALAVRCSITGAAVLAKSLADDLIACRALRESLWPSEGVRADA